MYLVESRLQIVLRGQVLRRGHRSRYGINLNQLGAKNHRRRTVLPVVDDLAYVVKSLFDGCIVGLVLLVAGYLGIARLLGDDNAIHRCAEVEVQAVDEP